MMRHTMLAFDAALQELASAVIAMADRTHTQLGNAVDALVNKNTALAREVRTADNDIDAMQHEIETKVIETIATRQPLAIDLREIIGALRIATELERIGDLAANIAKRAEQIGKQTFASEISLLSVLNNEMRFEERHETFDVSDCRRTDGLDGCRGGTAISAIFSKTEIARRNCRSKSGSG